MPSEYSDFITQWNLPGWGIFCVLVITLIKTWPIIQKNLLEARASREGRYSQRIADLEQAVEDCHREWRAEIAGLREQHTSSQLALVRTIIEIFPDAPQLGILLRALESGDRALRAMQRVKGPLGEVLGDTAQRP